MQVTAKTHAGQVRPLNEDYYALRTLGEQTLLAVICDGMGGAVGGNVASQTAAQLVEQAVQAAWRQNSGSRSIKHMLVAALDNANTQVFDLAHAEGRLSGMGTTIVAAIITPQAAYIAHAGDSRAYLYSNGALLQLTKDHSVVQVMVDAGQITEDEAKSHPRKNLITRVLGVEESLEVDYCEQELANGDVLLFCTDGLTNTVDLSLGLPLLLQQGEFANLAEDLVALANHNGGTDNITVVAIQIMP